MRSCWFSRHGATLLLPLQRHVGVVLVLINLLGDAVLLLVRRNHAIARERFIPPLGPRTLSTVRQLRRTPTDTRPREPWLPPLAAPPRTRACVCPSSTNPRMPSPPAPRPSVPFRRVHSPMRRAQ